MPRPFVLPGALIVVVLLAAGCTEDEPYQPIYYDFAVVDRSISSEPQPWPDAYFVRPDIKKWPDLGPPDASGPPPRKTVTIAIAPPEIRVNMGTFQMVIRHDKMAKLKADLWRVHGLYALDGKGARLYGGQPLVTDATWEAEFVGVSATGQAQPVGGARGHEMLNAPAKAWVDGKVVSLDKKATVSGAKLVLSQVTTLYHKQTGAKIGTHTTQHTVDSNGLELNQSVQWLTNVKLWHTYMTMLPVVRSVGTTPITDSGSRDPIWATEDLSKAGFKESETTAYDAKVWGKKSGFEARVTLLSNSSPESKFRFVNDPKLNLLRWDLSFWYDATKSHKWSANTRYLFSKNKK